MIIFMLRIDFSFLMSAHSVNSTALSAIMTLFICSVSCLIKLLNDSEETGSLSFARQTFLKGIHMEIIEKLKINDGDANMFIDLTDSYLMTQPHIAVTQPPVISNRGMQ